jgi:hypothetical protein
MHPTGPEQLRGVRRQLASVLADPSLGEANRAVVADAARILERLETSWPARRRFLIADNDATEALLEALGAAVPADRRDADRSEADAHERNLALRAALDATVAALPPSPEGDDARRRVATHLRRRLAADPSLNRRPEAYPTMSDEPREPTAGAGVRADLPVDLTMHDEHFAEQFPLSPLDDHLIHQTPDPIRVMWTGDPRAYERYRMECSDPAGEVLVATGGTFYPNLDRAEAFAIVNVGGVHTTVRGFRRLGADRADLRIGPIAPRIVQGLRWWRFELEPNEWGISYAIDFRDTTRQMFREPLSNSAGGTPPGRRNDVTTGFESFGTVEGWVEAGGRRIVIPAGSPGTRDRHWGVGRGVGGPALALGGRLHVGVSGNAFVAFPSWKLWGDRVFYDFGDARPGMGRVAKPSRRLRFEPDTHIFTEGIVDYTLDSGERKQVHYRRIGQQTAYLRCGMYGGTPGRGIHQGAYDGPDLVEGETYDVNVASVRASIAGLDEHLCRVTCDGEEAIGIYQPIDPAAYEACAAGRPGWSFLE